MDTSIWIALITSVGVGVVLRIMDIKWLPKAKSEDIAAVIRNELRSDVIKCKADLLLKDKEIDYWKKTYFGLIELLYKNHIEVPEKFMQPYRDDPTTPDIPGDTKK